MKAYYDRRAPEYDRSIPGVGDAVEHPEAAEEGQAHLGRRAFNVMDKRDD